MDPREQVELGTKFYADAETLKEGSGYYTFMNFLPANSDMWVENCNDCRVAMLKIMLTSETDVETLSNKTKVNPSSIFWFCSSCGRVVTAIGAYWEKVSINGKEFLSTDRIKVTENKLRGDQAMAANNPVDPGLKPSPDSTECPNCHSWRTVEPYKSDEDDTFGRFHHICPKCKTGEIYNPKQIQPEVTLEEN